MMVGVVALIASTSLVASAWLWAQRPWARREPAPPPERWEAWLSEERGQPAAVLVDLSWLDRKPPPERSEALWVIVDMAHPGRYGVGTAEEANRTTGLEQRLCDALAERDAAFVGRVRAQGTWRLLFMSPPGNDAVGAAAAVLGEADAGTFRCLAVHDPGWSAYHRCLAPDPERMRWIENARRFRDLTQAGEPVGVERPLAHAIRFVDLRASRRFTELASLYGFEVHDVERGDRAVVVHLVRADVVELERVHEVVMELAHLARSCDGEYGGWRCLAAAA